MTLSKDTALGIGRWGVLIIFALFASWNLQWDSLTLQHPDERHILIALNAGFDREYFNSNFEAYGNLFYFAGQFLHYCLPGVSYILLLRWISRVAYFALVGISGLAARSIGGSFYVAAWLTASNVAIIQQAHFATVDLLGVTFIMLAVLCRDRWLLLGIFSGLAASCKINFALVLVLPWLELLFSVLPTHTHLQRGSVLIRAGLNG